MSDPKDCGAATPEEWAKFRADMEEKGWAWAPYIVVYRWPDGVLRTKPPPFEMDPADFPARTRYGDRPLRKGLVKIKDPK